MLPDFKRHLSMDGSEPVGSTPAQFAAFLASEMTKWAEVVKKSGMKEE
jgi:tripartite-type tricarboxylate transporter receptor subunit TctC